MDEIKLPSDLDIGEGYGTIAWTVRGIYENYIGWFDGNPSSMFSTPPSDVYPDLVALAGGAESVAELAQRYFSQSEFERALHAADIALKADPQNESALNVRLEALQSLADQSENSNEKGWLQFGIRQTEAVANDR